MADALDHRIVVHRIGQDEAIWDQPGDGRDSRLVRNVAGCEDERSFLAMQVCEFALKLDQRVICPGNVAGTTGTGAHPGRRLDHGADHLRVLTHPEIIVRAPDHHVSSLLGRVPDRPRKAPGDTLEISKHPVATFVTEPTDRIREEFVIHHRFGLPAPARGAK